MIPICVQGAIRTGTGRLLFQSRYKCSNALIYAIGILIFQGFAEIFWRIRKFIYLCNPICGNSSVGRAQPCQGWGREFESRFPLHRGHQKWWPFFVCINALCCSGRTVPLFWSVLDFAAESRKIGRNEGDFGGLLTLTFTPIFTPVHIGTFRLLIS